jgi:uncharacterized protein YdhG (YjbR/CyaY superfamily)
MSRKLVDQYLKTVPEPHRSTLKKLRQTILKIEPNAKEVISYGMPAYKIDEGIICGFLASKKHCSYFPFSGSVLKELVKETAKYDQSIGTLRFEVDKPLPQSLVRKLIRVKKTKLLEKLERNIY